MAVEWDLAEETFSVKIFVFALTPEITFPLTNAALSDITCKMKWKLHPTFYEDSRFP